MVTSDLSKTTTVHFPSDAPEVPAVYVAVAHQNNAERVVYIDVAQNLRKALIALVEKQFRNFLTGGGACPFHEVRWWAHEEFRDPVVLEAAGLVALEAYDKADQKQARAAAAWELHNAQAFCIRMASSFSSPPHGRLLVTSLPQMFKRLSALEKRVKLIEQRLGALDTGETRH